MELKVFTIRDSKGEFYMQPFFKKSHGEAERDFTLLTQDPQSLVSKFPSDFDLYFLGTFNNETGKLDFVDTPQHIIKATNVKMS